MSSISTELQKSRVPVRRSYGVSGYLATLPWWLVGMALLGIWTIYLLVTNETYTRIFMQLRDGVQVTLLVSIVAYVMATVIGAVIGIIRSYPPTEETGFFRVILYHAATFYVEMFRGLPILVVLLITTFVVVPQFIGFVNSLDLGFELGARDISYMWRAIIGLGLCYGAFLSEIFRAGIQSIGQGQREAAQALGLNKWQVMRHIVMPQAFRRVLPPLGNDLIAMVKDSSLIAILAVRDITQLAKLSAGRSFLYLETYLIAAALYLTVTILGSLFVRWLEQRTGGNGTH